MEKTSLPKFILIFSLIFFPIFITASAFPGQATPTILEIKELIVEELIIRDSQGRARIRIGVDSTDSPVIFFYDQTGKKQLSLFAGPVEKETAKITLYSENQPILVVESKKGRGKITLYHAAYPELTSTVDSFKMKVLEFNLRQNSINTITSKLVQWSLYATPLGETDTEGLAIYVETRPTPTWKVNFEGGTLSTNTEEVKSAYQEAGDYLYKKILQPNFPKLGPEKFIIHFSIYGYKVGTWQNGIMKLAGEK